jgi:pSer/pThr/pTyr-binding forkhead associated (FHA) protein
MAETIHLVVQEGPEAGRDIHVPKVGMLRLGRAPKNDIHIEDKELSRHHCAFYFKEGRLFLLDLKSANGTKVNNRPIQDVRLSAGDVITLGNTTLKVLHDGQEEHLRMRPTSAAVAPLGPRVALVGRNRKCSSCPSCRTFRVVLPRVITSPADRRTS